MISLWSVLVYSLHTSLDIPPEKRDPKFAQCVSYWEDLLYLFLAVNRVLYLQFYQAFWVMNNQSFYQGKCAEKISFIFKILYRKRLKENAFVFYHMKAVILRHGRNKVLWLGKGWIYLSWKAPLTSFALQKMKEVWSRNCLLKAFLFMGGILM